jgi:hypothetical protein
MRFPFARSFARGIELSEKTLGVTLSMFAIRAAPSSSQEHPRDVAESRRSNIGQVAWVRIACQPTAERNGALHGSIIPSCPRSKSCVESRKGAIFPRIYAPLFSTPTGSWPNSGWNSLRAEPVGSNPDHLLPPSEWHFGPAARKLQLVSWQTDTKC